MNNKMHYTMNPIDSDNPCDGEDNLRTLDQFMLSSSPTFQDRLKRHHITLFGMDQKFNNFMDSLDYVKVPYVAGNSINVRTQYVIAPDGKAYQVRPTTQLPYELTGDWATDSPNFMLMGDLSLRNELSTVSGGKLVGYKRNQNTVITNLDSAMRGQVFNIESDMLGEQGSDISSLLNAALSSGEKVIRIPSGVWKMSTPLVPQNQDTFIFGDGFSTVLEFEPDIPLCIDMSKNRMRIANIAATYFGAGTMLKIHASPQSPLYNFDNSLENVLLVGNPNVDSLGFDCASYINTFNNVHIINFKTLIKFGAESNRNKFTGCTLRSEHTPTGMDDETALIVMDSDAGVGNAFLGCDIEGSPNLYLNQNGGQITFLGGYFEGAQQAAGIKQTTPYAPNSMCTLRDVFYSSAIALPARGNSLVLDNCLIHGEFVKEWPALQNFFGIQGNEFGSLQIINAQQQNNLIRISSGGHSGSYGIFDGLTGNYNIKPENFEFLDIFTRGLVIHNRGSDTLINAFGPAKIEGPYKNGFTSEKEHFLGEIPAGQTVSWPITEQMQDANYTIELRTFRNAQIENAFSDVLINVFTGSAASDQFFVKYNVAVAATLVDVSVEVESGFVTLKVINKSTDPFSFYGFAKVKGLVSLY